VFDFEDAKAKGLVDQEGYLEDAIRGVIEMAGLSEGDVRVVEYERQPTLISRPSSRSASAKSFAKAPSGKAAAAPSST
jgi:ClpP class serine protease